MRLFSLRVWLLLLLSILLQASIFPFAGPLPGYRASFAWIALVPLLLVLAQIPASGEKRSSFWVQSVAAGYISGVGWYLASCSWILQTMHLYGGLPGPVAFLILVLFALYLGLYHALFALLFASLRRAGLGVSGVLLCSPFLWVCVEFARARITSFPWNLLGYSQIDNLLLTPLAPVGGVMLLSFVIAAVNSLFAVAWLNRNPRRCSFLAILILLSAILQLGSYVWKPAAFAATDGAVLMQENIEVGAVGRTSPALSLLEELSQFSTASIHPQDLSEGSLPPAVIVWPEAPSHLLSSDAAFRNQMVQLAQSARAPLIIGSLGVDRDPQAARGYRLYDSASLFDGSGNFQGRYDKIHLVPWGEYIPYKELFAFADKLTEGVGDMDRGNARTVFYANGHTFGVFVCYESIFGDEVRQFALAGAEVLVNISDDGWYGDSGAPWQHLNMARMRAIENGRWLLRSTNTGVTTAIDPLGRMEAQAPRHTRGAYAFRFGFIPAGQTTLYTRHGDWFAWFCVAFIAIAITLSRVNAGRRA